MFQETPVDAYGVIATPADESSPDTSEEEYDIVKYNKEEVKVPKSERQTLLQKGLNYDKVYDKTKALEAQLKARDEWVAETYKDQGIKTWEEFQDALAEQAREKQLEDFGVDSSVADQIIEKDPKIQAKLREAEALKQRVAAEAAMQGLRQQIRELNEEFGLKVKDENDLDQLENVAQVSEYFKMGLPLKEAYYLANRNTLDTKKLATLAAKKASTTHIVPDAKGGSGDVIELPPDVLALYREVSPGLSVEEYRKHYTKSLRGG